MKLKIMAFEQMSEEQRKFMAIDQPELEKKAKMKNEGAGLLIIGIPLIILGVANQLVPIDLLFEYGSDVVKLLISAALVLAGIVCCVFGVKCMGKTGISIAEGICKQNNDFYTLEDIYDFYREVRENDNILIFLSGKMKIKAEDEWNTGLLTKNWLRIPGQRGVVLAKLPDVVAAWHDKDGSKDGFVGLYILRSDGNLYVMDSHPEFSEKVMQAIGQRNPLTILARRFTYEGRDYDARVNTAQVIGLYRQNLERQL